ncbi:hypothetical protein BJY04DRAFT_217527 [Aspergillus karnatakaensis]|uniref:uncharacterized protein n=1 Tax=Aspergillus karnatakaensis TaxID=1810916 RepID=UPI003CCE0BFA
MDTHDDNDDLDPGYQPRDSDSDTRNAEAPLVRDPVPSPNEHPPTPPDIDLPTISYFHHFITITIFTLPIFSQSRSTAGYWQATITPQALHHKWLLHGLLAISACHMATGADTQDLSKTHRSRAESFSASFFTGWEAIQSTSESGIHIPSSNNLQHEAASQVAGILSCALHENQQLSSTMNHLRGITTSCAAPYSSNSHNYGPHCPAPSTFAEASRILNSQISSSPSQTTNNHPNPTAEIQQTLTTLPQRMARVFSRPSHSTEVLTVLAAIAALIKCCETSFDVNKPNAAWHGMMAWLFNIPEQFFEMVTRNSAPAIVVVAHWAAFLVKRAEGSGWWFLKGLAGGILRQVWDRIEVEAVRELVAGLMP